MAPQVERRIKAAQLVIGRTLERERRKAGLIDRHLLEEGARRMRHGSIAQDALALESRPCAIDHVKGASH